MWTVFRIPQCFSKLPLRELLTPPPIEPPTLKHRGEDHSPFFLFENQGSFAKLPDLLQCRAAAAPPRLNTPAAEGMKDRFRKVCC